MRTTHTMAATYIYDDLDILQGMVNNQDQGYWRWVPLAPSRPRGVRHTDRKTTLGDAVEEVCTLWPPLQPTETARPVNEMDAPDAA